MPTAGTQCQSVTPTKSGFKGVQPFKLKAGARYRAYITCPPLVRGHKRVKHLGMFATAEEAALAYNEAAIILFGDGAVLNNVAT